MTTELDAAVEAAVAAALAGLRGRVESLTREVGELRSLVAFVLGGEDEEAAAMLAEVAAHYAGAPDPAAHLLNVSREKRCR